MRMFFRPLLIAILPSIAACSGVASEDQVLDVAGEDVLVPSWEEFRASAEPAGSHPDHLVVEGDLFFSSEAALRDYYDQRVEETHDKLAISRRISTSDDMEFPGNAARDIVYCVHNNFRDTNPSPLISPTPPDLGDQKDEAIADIAAAARAWENVANVKFRYDSSQDSNCTDDNNNVDFAFQNITNPLYLANGCAMNKYMDWAAEDIGCIGNEGAGGTVPVSGVLVADYNHFPWPEYPQATRVGLLTHELGHMLGFRHEFAWAPTPCEAATSTGIDVTGRRLTAYDTQSVMNYLTNSCPGPSQWKISKLDGVGARSIYGSPVSWYVMNQFYPTL